MFELHSTMHSIVNQQYEQFDARIVFESTFVLNSASLRLSSQGHGSLKFEQAALSYCVDGYEVLVGHATTLCNTNTVMK